MVATVDDVFGNLSQRSVAKLATVQRERTYNAHSILFVQGDEGRDAYRLLSGSVRLFRSTTDGREVTVHMVKPGELFAEIVLFERETYPVSAVATERSVVAAIPRRSLYRLLDDGEFRDDFLRDLVGKMRLLSEQLYVLATMDVRRRLIRFFQVRYGQQATVHVDLSKKDVAAAISVRPETLSRVLARLEQERLFVWQGRTVTIDAALWDDR